MFRCLEHMANEDFLKKPEGFTAEKGSFTGNLIAAFNHLKKITQKTESNFSERCTEKGQEAMARKKPIRYKRKKKSLGQWLRPEEGPREAVKSQSLETCNIQRDMAMRSLI